MADIRQKVAIIGSGIIGRSWAMLFAAADFRVVVYDKEPKQLTDAMAEIRVQLDQLKKLELLRGNLTVDQQLTNISTTQSIQDCVTGAVYIQECVPERLHMKQSVYNEIDNFLNDSMILASSASGLLPSALVENVRHRNRFVVAHPSNPPFHMPLVELVPSPWTDSDVVPKAKDILETTGQVPVVLMKEIPGFVNNRLQNAMFSEIWRLIRDDVISVEDLEKVMHAGLGRQYAFVGPIEALYLESGGMHNVAQRYGDEIERVQSSMTENMPFKGPVLDKLQAGMERLGTPTVRRQRRDKILAALSKLINDLDKNERKYLFLFCYFHSILMWCKCMLLRFMFASCAATRSHLLELVLH